MTNGPVLQSTCIPRMGFLMLDYPLYVVGKNNNPFLSAERFWPSGCNSLCISSRPSSSLFSLINEDFCRLLYFFRKFHSWQEIFIGVVSQFVI